MILETKNLSHAYGVDEIRVEALNNVNIAVHKGEFVAIMGPSGCGKSTLMHMLAGWTARRPARSGWATSASPL